MPDLDLLFVYGTLKEGFCNFAINGGQRVAGDFITVQAFGLYIVGEPAFPWLVDADPRGLPVQGQLFRVGPKDWPAIDALEQVDEPGWYRRSRIQVRQMTSAEGAQAPPLTAFVYFGDSQALQTRAVHLGPLAAFTLVQQSRYCTVP
jgi:gamma-glutamylaminecyclotransferase